MLQVIVPVGIGIAGMAENALGDPSYTYQTEADNNHDVCDHMKGVFNKNFRRLWSSEPIEPKDDPRYGQGGSYEFPKLTGVVSDTRATFDMRYSKTPSSPEFDAVEWQEGRMVAGARRGQQPSKFAAKPFPVLVAYLDIDNDGHVDTVMKEGFSRGYNYMLAGSGNGLHDEFLLTWRSQKREFPPASPLWPLMWEAPVGEAPVSENGTYLRPFIYNGHSYIASYEMDLGKHFDAANKPPYKPRKETMSILDVHSTGALLPSDHSPRWNVDVVCLFKMSQVE